MLKSEITYNGLSIYITPTLKSKYYIIWTCEVSNDYKRAIEDVPLPMVLFNFQCRIEDYGGDINGFASGIDGIESLEGLRNCIKDECYKISKWWFEDDKPVTTIVESKSKWDGLPGLC